MKETGKVRTRNENGIAVITFSHPKSNSMPLDLLKKLSEEIISAGENKKIKVIVLQSEGDKAFCAGASFDELLAINDFEKGKEFFLGFARVINAMRKCPKFIILRVQGKAVGGALGLIAAADYALALDTAAIKLSEFALGIGPFVIGPVVERKIGRAFFSQMTIDTNWYGSSWALDKGLYAGVYSSMEELDNAVILLAKKLEIYSPEATKELKKIFWEGCDDWNALLEERAEISGRLVLSDFTSNYIKQFQGK